MLYILVIEIKRPIGHCSPVYQTFASLITTDIESDSDIESDIDFTLAASKKFIYTAVFTLILYCNK